MKSADELTSEELHYAIVTEVERLETDNFNNSAVLCNSLLSNDSKCDCKYPTKVLMKPDFPTDINAVHSNKTSSDCYNYLPKTDETRVGDNFVKEICDEIVSTRNECEIQINLTVPRFQFVIIVNQMQQMHEMVINRLTNKQCGSTESSEATTGEDFRIGKPVGWVNRGSPSEFLDVDVRQAKYTDDTSRTTYHHYNKVLQSLRI